MAAEMVEGRLVMAKIKGFSWWPAQIVNPASKGMQEKNNGSRFVYFFGTKRYGWARRECILLFTTSLHLVSTANERKLKAALQEAQRAVVDSRDVADFESSVKRQGLGVYLESNSAGSAASATDGADEIRSMKRKAAEDNASDSASEKDFKAKKSDAAAGAGTKEKSRSAKDALKFHESNDEGMDFAWIGNPTHIKDGRKYYHTFMKNDQTFRCYDCAYLKPNKEDEEMYIVLIKEMWESDDGKKEIQGHWIYRSSDMPKSVEMLHKSEVFLSDWVDCNPIESVVQRAPVIFSRSDPKQMNGKLLAKSKDLHICLRKLEPKSGKLRFLKDVDEDIVRRILPMDTSEDDSGDFHRQPPRDYDPQVLERAEKWIPLELRLKTWTGIKSINQSNKLPQAPNPLRHDTRVTDIALSPSGVHALTCSIGGTLRLWDVESGSMKMQWKDLEETNSLDELHTVDKGLLTWVVQAVLQRLCLHKAPVLRVEVGWSEEGGVCLSESADGAVVKWVFDGEKELFEKAGDVFCEKAGGINLLYPPRGIEASCIAVAHDRGLSLYDLKTMERCDRFDDLFSFDCKEITVVPPYDDNAVSTACWQTLLLCGRESKDGHPLVKLFQISGAGKEKHTCPSRKITKLREFLPPVADVDKKILFGRSCLASNGRYAILAQGFRVYIWQLKTGSAVAMIEHGPKSEFLSLLLHPQKKILWLGTAAGMVEHFRQE
ncbi:hypothetical protein GUITHDRAFT_136838 [Guillardia theta CCMP2712]|uniref:PWWP domain-containing protein n=1 Tax=Guillardia theta (strain CCMP2712) TaxID=905079 RepID=L1JIM2_GUITC|nr:hypothetical protein GUITHDRAFT_136838 [Guillardia theta CCMP2712]EKX48326.1 hypothetical protein GUITHDRAFT_136838 [Guillardia theta CCMP2712]|eukprot:XP_005835306.1 hypothetical protein GUITHDRAFT_136838 [Guillardia theta CCMP2712]